MTNTGELIGIWIWLYPKFNSLWIPTGQGASSWEGINLHDCMMMMRWWNVRFNSVKRSCYAYYTMIRSTIRIMLNCKAASMLTSTMKKETWASFYSSFLGKRETSRGNPFSWTTINRHVASTGQYPNLNICLCTSNGRSLGTHRHTYCSSESTGTLCHAHTVYSSQVYSVSAC